MTLYSMNPSNCASKCRLAIYEKDAAVEIVPIPGGDLKSEAERLLADADAALYRAKASGRNALEFTG